MRDTTTEAEQVQAAVLRELSGAARVQLALELSEQTRELALSRLRARYPRASRQWLVGELLREVLPRDELPPALR